MGSLATRLTATTPAPGVPFFTPKQSPIAGTTTADSSKDAPTLFQPIKIRGLTLQNRFIVAPMCMYSADDGHLTDFHVVHLGSFALRGAALTIVEATSVTPNGRISPEDSGLWKDSQIAPLKRVADYIHSQGQKIGIQLAHAGRKGSTLAPNNTKQGGTHIAEEHEGGWPDNVWGPSDIPFADDYPKPKAMTLAQIEELKEAFAAAARRAVAGGMDMIEIHSAHGYLLSEFVSPLSNHRTDKYGGSFENRIRAVLEVCQAVRAAIPDTMPLFLRISATEWMEKSGQESWTLDDSVKLARQLSAIGVDLLDVSSGGNNSAQKIDIHPHYQIDLAGQIRQSLRKAGDPLLIGAVGLITNAEMARDIVQEGSQTKKTVKDGLPEGSMGNQAERSGAFPGEAQADVILLARQFLREPEFVLRVAKQLGVDVAWPGQYGRAQVHWDVTGAPAAKEALTSIP